MRTARRKSSEAAFYHLFTRVAGPLKYFPLIHPEARRKLIELLYHYTSIYCCVLVSFEIMGNHYHLILWMQKYRRLARAELRRRAKLLWGSRAELHTASWCDEAWERFNRKLFDLSALMQHLNGEYAKWHNRRFNRRGHFWADRFQNPELLDLKAVQDCLCYVETNALRARLVDHPQQWEASSAWMRCSGRTRGLMPIERIFAEVPPSEAFTTYRRRLHDAALVCKGFFPHLGSSPESTPPTNPLWCRTRQRFFSDGIAIGSRPQVDRVLQEFQFQGHYLRRKQPIPQLHGRLHTLREQRSHARE